MNDKNQDLVLKTYQNMPHQFEQVFKEFKSVKLPASFKNINKVLVCGMGGSALGPHLVQSVFQKYIKVPIIISSDYKLPKWVDKNTLIIISSFSGDTEEPINCYQEANRKKLKIFTLCSGGKLAKVKTAKFVFQAKYDYALEPRFGIGYLIAIFICLFKELKLLDFYSRKIDKGIKYFQKGKKLAEKLVLSVIGKMPFVIASEHLIGNAHIWQNQLNETSKNFGAYFPLPEVCHHQFEGMTFPKSFKKDMIYVLISSNLYHPRNQKRYEVTKSILKKRRIKFIEIKAKGDNVWSQSMYILGASSYITLYLAYYNKTTPQGIPWVDLFKERMRE